MSDVLIHGSLVLTGGGAAPQVADLLVRNGRIVAVEPTINADCERIDDAGCIVMPGMVDANRRTWQTLTWGICGGMSGAGYWTAIRHQAARSRPIRASITASSIRPGPTRRGWA